MSDRSATLTQAPPPVEQPPIEQLMRGYRWRSVLLPDGGEISVQVPLTPEDFLNPQEGDFVPESTFHATAINDLYSLLRARFGADPNTAVFSDLIIRWGIPGLSDPAPDIAVIPDVRDRDRNRRTFKVREEGTRPLLIIEVVSPDYRKQDLIDKVEIYERAGVQEYVILEQREQRGQVIDLITGYRLEGDHYRPLLLEDDGRMVLQTVGLYISLQNGKVMLEDAATGERLHTAEEAEAARAAEAQARAQAEQRAQEAEQRVQAEAQARAELAAQLEALRAELARLKSEPPTP
ncbi:MAG: Uma2 family endonuclease [Candidatus Tectomicrobia bacterium]|uniref:Uma2 family endonuclease n=1 Tax=Tectimicrobiota bacterium TaxID=2528274 RepID=A0A932FXY9_UNCTE|nr:Uma2 family endonuclease [Candidatus Tectomicrobia bacterium]